MTRHRRLAKRLGNYYWRALMLVTPFKDVIKATSKRQQKQKLFKEGLEDIAEAALLREFPQHERN